MGCRGMSCRRAFAHGLLGRLLLAGFLFLVLVPGAQAQPAPSAFCLSVCPREDDGAPVHVLCDTYEDLRAMAQLVDGVLDEDDGVDVVITSQTDGGYERLARYDSLLSLYWILGERMAVGIHPMLDGDPVYDARMERLEAVWERVRQRGRDMETRSCRDDAERDHKDRKGDGGAGGAGAAVVVAADDAIVPSVKRRKRLPEPEAVGAPAGVLVPAMSLLPKPVVPGPRLKSASCPAACASSAPRPTCAAAAAHRSAW